MIRLLRDAPRRPSVRAPGRWSWSRPGNRGWDRRTARATIASRDIRLLQQFALCAGQRRFSSIDQAGGKLPEVILGGVAILALQQDARLAAASSTARITTDPPWRTTSRWATMPLGSFTRSEVTRKTRPRKTVVLEMTSSFLSGDSGFRFPLLSALCKLVFLVGIVSSRI